MRIKPLAAAAAVASIIAAAVCIPTAQAVSTPYEAQDIPWSVPGSVIADSTATGGQAVSFTRNTAGTGTPDGAVQSVTVRARGVECWAGERPNLRVSIGGTVLGNQAVPQSGWADYTFTPQAPTSGTVKVEFTNEFAGHYWLGVCYRTLLVDTVTVNTAAAPEATPTTTTTTPPATTPPPVAGGEYVAMGDSYSSGEGANRTATTNPDPALYVAPVNNGCNSGRSIKAYPYLIASDEGYTLKNVSCGGSNIDHVLTTGQYGEPPQIQALSADTRLVTGTIGGNDAGLLYVLQVCFQNGWWFLCNNPEGQVNVKIDAMKPRLVTMFREILTRAPNAVVRWAGYPDIVAPPGQPVGACTWLDGNEQAAMQRMLVRTNNAIRDALNQVRTETGRDIAYVEPLAGSFPAVDTSCSGLPTRYMNGAEPTSPFHPNIRGQRLYADLYEASW